MNKKNIYIVIIAISIATLGFTVALFHCGRIIIDIPPFFKKYKSDYNQKHLIKKASLIWININGSKSTENIELKMKDKILTATDLIKNWTKFIQQECGINITLNHIAIGKNSIVIDIKNSSKHLTDVSTLQMWNLLESIKSTIKSAFPDIKNVYIYEKGKPYKTTFFSYDSINQSDFIINKNESYKKNKHENYTIIPLFFSRDGKDLGNCYEKGFFQKIAQQNNNLLILNEPVFSNEWINAISKIKNKNILFTHIISNKQTNKITMITNSQQQNCIKPKYPNVADSYQSNICNDKIKSKIEEWCINNEFIFEYSNIQSYAIYYSSCQAYLIECFIKDTAKLPLLNNLLTDVI
jgi:hypothetical protein